jgi:hypothetical protein
MGNDGPSDLFMPPPYSRCHLKYSYCILEFGDSELASHPQFLEKSSGTSPMALEGPKEMTALPATALPLKMHVVAVVLSRQPQSTPGNTMSISLMREGQTVTMYLQVQVLLNWTLLLFRIVSGMGEQRV